MSNVLNPDTFGEKLYNRLPALYRTEDVNNNLALKRYLESLSEGGFAKLINEMNGLLNIVDPEKTPHKVLKYLFGQYGVTMFQGVDEKLLRKLLQIISDILSRKGSKSTIYYIASILTGCECVINYTIEDDMYLLKISFEVEDESQLLSDADKNFLESILKDYIPFYWDIIFDSYIGYNNEIGSIRIDTEYFTYIHDIKGEETTQFVLRENDNTTIK